MPPACQECGRRRACHRVISSSRAPTYTETAAPVPKVSILDTAPCAHIEVFLPVFATGAIKVNTPFENQWGHRHTSLSHYFIRRRVNTQYNNHVPCTPKNEPDHVHATQMAGRSTAGPAGSTMFQLKRFTAEAANAEVPRSSQHAQQKHDHHGNVSQPGSKPASRSTQQS